MEPSLPDLQVPYIPFSWDNQGDLALWDWSSLPALPPLVLADGSGPAVQQTAVRLCYDRQALYVHFDCQDRDIWGVCTARDDPLYDEEVVEVFLGAGRDDPVRYYEFEVSPNGVLFDGRVYNPTSQRSELQVNRSWNCPGIRWQAERNDAAHQWWAVLAIPWTAVAPPGELPSIWRGNFYRIERPRDGQTEFSCWSPTQTEPADFHKPACFGRLILSGP